jgi:hypothetical protein
MLPEKRFGVAMSSLKAHIVDLVQRGGDDGMPCDNVWRTVFRSRHGSRETMKAHVWQINQMIADEGYRIIYDRCDTPCYRIVRLGERRRRA